MIRQVLLLPIAKQQLFESPLWCLTQIARQESLRWPIETAIESLAINAERHPMAEEAAAIGVAIRQMEVGLLRERTYRILFAIHEDRVVIYAFRRLTSPV